MSDEVDVLAALREDGYQLGNCAAILYDRTRTELFPDGYLGDLYRLCVDSRRRSGDGIVSTIFGGNPMSHFDAIVPFLAVRPLIILGIWEDQVFVPAGLCFIQLYCGTEPGQRSVFAGYGFFRHIWGTPEIKVLAMLGLALLFEQFKLVAVHGTRYESNTLTARFMAQFGFEQTGNLPRYQLKDGVLVSGIVTSLLREDFEEYVKRFLLEQLHGPEAESEPEPEIEPARELPNSITLQAIAPDGTVLQEEEIEATADAILAQGEEYARRFPDCRWAVKKEGPRGQNGGNARAKKLSPERRREIAQKAAAARWNKPNPF